MSHSQPPSIEAAKALAWRVGALEWKLHSEQAAIYRQIQDSKASRFVLEIARRFGKTWLLLVIASETCLRKPGARVVYGAPTLKHLEEFVIPAMEEIIQDAPDDTKPVFNGQSGHWKFPNGSHIHLFGADDKRKADRGRGPSADLVIFDEAGFTDILRYVLRSVFRPQTLHTKGLTLLGSTPAEAPDHDFTKIAEIAEARGTYARRTIHQNPLLSKERVAEFIAEDAADEGMTVEEYVETDTFRREYLAERVTDKMLVVVPEWAQRHAELFRPVAMPEYFDAYTVLDPGGADPHGVLFGWYDFKPSAGPPRIVIEDELLLRDSENTAELVKLVKEKEGSLWGTDLYAGTLRGMSDALVSEAERSLPDWLVDKLKQRYAHQPYQRWSDTNIQLIRDLHQLHGMSFIPTAKDDLQWAVNNVRVLIREGKLWIHPRCVNLHRQLLTTIWKNERRKDFKRKAGEHGDLVAALVYLCRNVNRQRNPYPIQLNVAPGTQPSAKMAAKPADGIGQAFLGATPLGRKLLKRRAF